MLWDGRRGGFRRLGGRRHRRVRLRKELVLVSQQFPHFEGNLGVQQGVKRDLRRAVADLVMKRLQARRIEPTETLFYGVGHVQGKAKWIMAEVSETEGKNRRRGSAGEGEFSGR